MLLHYIDNEVPSFAEWTAVTEQGSSTVARSTAASFPDRGSYGLRFTCDGSNNDAYVYIDSIGHTLSTTCAVGFWINVRELNAGNVKTLYLSNSSSEYTVLLAIRTGDIRLYGWDNSGTLHYTDDGPALEDKGWNYVQVVLHTDSSAGYVKAYVNGLEEVAVTGLANNTRAADLDRVDIGMVSNPADGQILDIDEIKIGAALADVEPYSPTPADDYVSARRTVLIVPETADGHEFADYVCGQCSLPYANRLFLPTVTGESLADYATFQSEVEDVLDAFLANFTGVAGNCCAFLVGYDAQGYFTSGGVKHSATSRLMNYSNAFSSQTANPLYRSSGLPTSRITATELAAAGVYACSRVDADTLANAKAIVDAAVAAAALSSLAETDKLFSDDSTFKSSLGCQHLRIETAALASCANDAFVWGDTGSPTFGDAGSRICFTDDSADSADTQTATSEIFDATVTNGYAAGLGFGDTAGTLQPGPFFEILRLGGTLAEAAMEAINYLDYTAVLIGLPWMTVNFRRDGYNVYAGAGGAEDIDWASPVAYARGGVETAAVPLEMSPGRKYALGLRAVSAAGVEERNAHVFALMETDAQGDLLPVLPVPYDVTAEACGGSVGVGFTCDTPPGHASPEKFEVFCDGGTGSFNLDEPDAVIEDIRAGQREFEAALTGQTLPSRFAVRACAAGHAGPLSPAVEVATRQPAAPVILTGSSL